MRFTPVLPVAAFEIEIKTGTDAKHIKGSVSNLDNLGAQMGIIVVGSGNLDLLRKKDVHKNKSDIQLEKILIDRVYRWVYAEFQARTRIVIMSERQVIEWAKRLGVSIPTRVEA